MRSHFEAECIDLLLSDRSSTGHGSRYSPHGCWITGGRFPISISPHFDHAVTGDHSVRSFSSSSQGKVGCGKCTILTTGS